MTDASRSRHRRPGGLGGEATGCRAIALRCLAVAVLLAGWAGCSETPAAREARIARENAFARDVDMVKSLEDRRCERMRNTFAVMDEQTRHDERLTRQNVKALGDWLPNEVREWNKKQPAYQKDIKHQFEGDCDSIEHTAPRFVY
jgi:hypothetical protein